MEFPESSAIQAADYDPEGRTLDVTFTSGRRYTYFSVPDWEFDGLVTATSAGEYFNTRIRDQYAYKERRPVGPQNKSGAAKPRKTIH